MGSECLVSYNSTYIWPKHISTYYIYICSLFVVRFSLHYLWIVQKHFVCENLGINGHMYM